MKKQDAAAPKLAFNKEKIANLSPADLDQVHGGQADTIGDFTGGSTRNDFTCCACTTITEAQAE